MIRNNQNRRRRGGNNGPRPQQMGGGNNYGNRLDNRQRGNASQLLEKYRSLARDAQQAGDRVTAEYYLQYADHYYRVLGDYRDKAPDQNRQRRDSYEDDSAGYANTDDGDDGDDEDGDDREDSREDNRVEARDDNRGNWRDERPNRDRTARDNGGRDGQRENSQRDGGQRENNQRENNQRDGGQRDGGQREQNREPRRDGERQPWKSNRDGGEQPRSEQARPDQNRGESRGDRDGNRNDGRRERRPEMQRTETPRAIEPALNDEGPIPGLPGPATLRAPRDAAAPTVRPERRTLRRETPAAAEMAPVAAAVMPAPVETLVELGVETIEAPAPRRRGRPRKVVEEVVAES